MRLMLLAGSLTLAAALGALCERAIQGPPELVVVWLLAIIGVAIEGTTLLLTYAVPDDSLARATIARRD